MGAEYSSESPLDTAATTVDERTTQAFEVLGNDTRLAILLALWEAIDRGPTPVEQTDSTLPFSQLRRRVGMRDPGQFRYHLRKLEGTFVEATEKGYALTEPAEEFLRKVFAGTLMEHASFHDVPFDDECSECGTQLVMDYVDGILIERCTRCEGVWQIPGRPPGVRNRMYRPPAGLVNRTSQEFRRDGYTYGRHRWMAMVEGVCPDCSGTVTVTIHVCTNHDTTGETVCKTCGTVYELLPSYECDVCKSYFQVPEYAPIFVEMAVKTFYYDHGLDIEALLDENAWGVLSDTITGVEVRATEPLAFEVTVDLDGDRLIVSLDENARLVGVTESKR